jgi:hypothetical protein
MSTTLTSAQAIAELNANPAKYSTPAALLELVGRVSAVNSNLSPNSVALTYSGPVTNPSSGSNTPVSGFNLAMRMLPVLSMLRFCQAHEWVGTAFDY